MRSLCDVGDTTDADGIETLMVGTVLPRGGRAGGDLGSKWFAEALLRAGARLAMLGYDRPGESDPALPWEMSAGARMIETGGSVSRALRWYAMALLARNPYTHQKFISHRYRHMLAQALRRPRTSVAIIDKAQAGWTLPMIPADVRVIYLAHNAESALYAAQAEVAADSVRRVAYRREARLMARVEEALVRRAVATWTFGTTDAASLRARFPEARIASFMPMSTDVCVPGRGAHQRDVGLLGTWSWGPNRAGLEWFVSRVVPHLDPDLKIEVAGRGAEWLRRNTRIGYLGTIESARDFVAQTRVMALPTVLGCGIQIKAVNAIGSGAEVVATAGAVSGLQALPATVVVHDKPEAFASAVNERVRTPRPLHLRRAVASEWVKRSASLFDLDVQREFAAACRVSLPLERG